MLVDRGEPAISDISPATLAKPASHTGELHVSIPGTVVRPEGVSTDMQSAHSGRQEVP
jgi:hypothetical protein